MREVMLKKAWDLRAPLHADTSTNAYRLFCGEGEGIPGIVVDRLGSVLVLQRFEGQCSLSSTELKTMAEFLLMMTGAEACYLKEFVADRTKEMAGDAMYSFVPFAGKAAPPELTCLENGLSFEIHPYDGFSYGLFLDQRENRKYLGEIARGKEVFNGFSYTCGFSVYAAKAGAQVTSVDLSKAYLDWGKRNFTANGLSVDGHRFFADDVFAVLEKDVKKGRTYDVIILDPPSFSRSKKGGVFSLKQDQSRLLKLAESVLRPGGYFFFSCNYSAWTSTSLKTAAEKMFVRQGKWQSLPPVPLDFQRQTQQLSAFLIRQ